MKLTKLAFTLAILSMAAFGQAAPAPASRLLSMFLDLNSLSAADLATAQDQAVKFVQEQMTGADRISIMTNTSQVNVLQAFTSDRDTLIAALRSIMPVEQVVPVGNGAELNILAADRQLAAIAEAVKVLSVLPDKKAMIYFASGIPRNGVDNQTQLRAATSAAMRANVSIYPVDARGLVATSPR